MGKKSEADAQVDDIAWNAITNKWLSGNTGLFLREFKKLTHEELIETNLVLNGASATLFPNVRIYQVRVLTEKGAKSLNFDRHRASLVVDGSRLTFIETDNEAISYLNDNLNEKHFSMVRAFQEVLSFGELRGYSLITEESMQLFKASSDTRSKIGDWSFSGRGGKNKTTIEVGFITLYKPKSPETICCKRYTFEFQKEGKLRIDQVGESIFIGLISY